MGLIEKYRELMPKKGWHDIKDIYEQVSESCLKVWGNNGRYYLFIYASDEEWTITMYPTDPDRKRFWHGKGWADVSL